MRRSNRINFSKASLVCVPVLIWAAQYAQATEPHKAMPVPTEICANVFDPTAAQISDAELETAKALAKDFLSMRSDEQIMGALDTIQQSIRSQAQVDAHSDILKRTTTAQFSAYGEDEKSLVDAIDELNGIMAKGPISVSAWTV